ncbi:MAG: diacylglycerol kinase family lipid kinase [Deltaproteobacteria bacterium]|nr:diacylglycerol kinase family lipid kinase [Deltaproteobacteria bacterium]
MKIRFILNPAAGGGKGKKFLPLLRARAAELGLDADWAVLSSVPQALAAATSARKDGCELLVACGGDGTIHFLLPAVVHHRFILGIIPLGTANDLARNWRIPLNPIRALELLQKGRPALLDLIQVDDRAYVAGAAGWGFDVAVIERVASWRKPRPGVWPYFLAALLEFSRYRPPRLELRGENWSFGGPAWQLICSKVSRYALAVKIAPLVKGDDGLMEVCLLPDLARARLLWHFPRLLFSGCKEIPGARSFRAPVLTISSTPALNLQGDGELIGRTPATLRVLPRRLPVMLSGEGAFRDGA